MRLQPFALSPPFLFAGRVAYNQLRGNAGALVARRRADDRGELAADASATATSEPFLAKRLSSGCASRRFDFRFIRDKLKHVLRCDKLESQR